MLTPARRLARFAFAGLAILVLALGYRTTRAASDDAEEVERQYSFSADPEVEILRIEHSGNWSVVDSLYGDGRLVFGTDHKALYLSYQEQDGIIRDLVDAGIMEYDTGKVRALMKQRPTPYRSPEGAGIGVIIQLDDYRGPLQDSGPARSAIGMASPRFLREQYPEIDEIQALSRLLDKISEYRDQAAAKGEQSE